MKITVVGGGPGGLYFALLAKKEWPSYDINVYERNRADDTFGFGVVFSDATLGIFRDYDKPSYEMIRRNFAYWDDVNIHFKGHVFSCSGNGFCGCSRKTLLLLLQERCRELGVTLHFEHEFEPEDLTKTPFADSDLIVASDGINSKLRRAHEAHFGTTIDHRKNKFCWLGSTKPLDAFKYHLLETEHGPFIAHTYQYEPNRSTWIIEMSEETWAAHGFGEMSEAEYTAEIGKIFAEELDGHELITNRSLWLNFPTVRNERWVKDNIVLIGDAKASAHYSIGSGTKLAMEDSIALLEAMRANPQIKDALTAFERDRREEVGKLQHSAEVSLAWFEEIKRHWQLEPEQFAFGLMSRSKQITYDNLFLRDERFVKQIHDWFIADVRKKGFGVADDTPPMFTPFRLREMVVPNRVVVSPMAQYSAVDGVPTDWHLVHLGSRAVGGAGLVFVEMTCPSPDARITPGCTGLWNEVQCESWKRIVDFVHENSQAKICMQLGHAGRKGSTQLGWEKMDYPLSEGNWPIYSASPIPYLPESQTPQELTRSDMDRIIAEFVQSTRYADAAGFDMIEVHMAHGYLLASFISPLTNQRTDEYGGSVEARMRFPLELFQAMRDVWPEHKPMSVRISATDWYPGGLSEADLIEAAQLLKDAGADLIDVSTGQTVPDQKPVYGRMYQTTFADKVRQNVHIPTMTVGNITTSDQVNTILLQGRADLVALARPHLTNPAFTLHGAAEQGYEAQVWPKQYLAGKHQSYRLAEREQAELKEMRLTLKPPTHEVKDEE